MEGAQAGAFAEALRSLQVLHDSHILELQKENAELHNELRSVKERLVSTTHREDQDNAVDNVCVLEDTSVQKAEWTHERQEAFPDAKITSQDSLQSALNALPQRGSQASRRSATSPVTRVQRLVASKRFEVTMGVVIGINAIQIGVEAQLARVGTTYPFLTLADLVFYIIYVVELFLRLGARGPLEGMKNPWIQFDALLIFCGTIDFLAVIWNPNFIALRHVMVFRILRCARVARIQRLMANCKTLWLLVQGLLNSMSTLLWTFVIIAILIYMFAIMALEIIPPDADAGDTYKEVRENYFSDLPNACLTLLQGLTLDSVGSIYRPLILEKPFLFFYFMTFIFVVSIALMNLVTAIMVESSLNQAAEDKDAKLLDERYAKKKLIEQLHVTFMELDSDESGALSLTELVQAHSEVKHLLNQVMNMHDIEQIFQSLDFDGSGKIEIAEFVQGLLEAQRGKSMEIHCLRRQSAYMVGAIREIHTHIQQIAARAYSQDIAPLPVRSIFNV